MKLFLEYNGHMPLVMDMLEEKQLKHIIARAFIKACEDEIKTLQGHIGKGDFTYIHATESSEKAAIYQRLVDRFNKMKTKIENSKNPLIVSTNGGITKV
jgi:hypothetical protein